MKRNCFKIVSPSAAFHTIVPNPFPTVALGKQEGAEYIRKMTWLI